MTRIASPLRRRLLLGAATASFALGARAQSPTPRVQIVTSMGTIELRLDPQRAPATVDNFLHYVRDGFYAGTVFHRVIPGFMIQGGGMDVQLREKATRPPVAIESRNGLRNLRGTIAMARTGDPNSATSQFFINLVDNAGLDYPSPDGYGYTVFGTVTKGMDVVDHIATVHTGSVDGNADVPLQPIVIKQVTILN